jgi:UDP-N-acetylglucosamine 1-carboxyvinyltransferase
MTDLIVHGGTPLRGRLVPSANKNAVLPILCATLLTREPVRLRGIPEITDVKKILDIFRALGSEVRVDFDARVLDVHHKHTRFDETEHRLPEEMRSSIMLVPGLLARFGVARIEDDVKGCTLGMREIDPHVEVMQSFGATVERRSDGIVMRADRPLRATRHWLDYASVTTTENYVLCAALAQGQSQLMNAASEPHVQEFCQFMQMLGARIDGVGTSRLVVEGVRELGGGEFTFAEDFHEIVTFLALGAITGGAVEVRNSTPEQFPLIDRTFAKFGVHVVHDGGCRAPRSMARSTCASPSRATSCKKSRPRPGLTCRWICCRSSSRWASRPRAA